jgi:hypothetical protein
MPNTIIKCNGEKREISGGYVHMVSGITTQKARDRRPTCGRVAPTHQRSQGATMPIFTSDKDFERYRKHLPIKQYEL